MLASPEMSDADLLAELEPTADKLLGEHMERSKEWFPHQLVPYSQGRDFESDYEWSPKDSAITDEDVRSALFVNLLTEDNLPYYTSDIQRMFQSEGAWREWANRWTAEEGRHSIVMRDYLTATRATDPVMLERGRMHQVSTGAVPHPPTARRGTIYVTLQELATRISHRNTGDKMREPIGKRIMDRVGGDENNHFLFYRGIGSAALELDPSGFVEDLEKEATNFEMPGTGIKNFRKHAVRIALSGIYGLTEYKEKVLDPTLRHWNIWNREDLRDKGNAARDRLATFVEVLGIEVAKEKEKREARALRKISNLLA